MWERLKQYRALKKQNPKLEFEPIEIPGNGTLHQSRTPLNVEETIQSLQNQSSFLKKNNPINLLGISLGGMLALKWAELIPSQIENLIIINSSLKQTSSFYKRLRINQYFKLFECIKKKDLEEKISEI